MDAEIAQTDKAIAALGAAASGFSKEGLEAVAHLGGIAGMRQFVQTGGTYNANDKNASLADYYRAFSPAGSQIPSGVPQYTDAPGGVAARDAGRDLGHGQYGPGLPAMLEGDYRRFATQADQQTLAGRRRTAQADIAGTQLAIQGANERGDTQHGAELTEQLRTQQAEYDKLRTPVEQYIKGLSDQTAAAKDTVGASGEVSKALADLNRVGKDSGWQVTDADRSQVAALTLSRLSAEYRKTGEAIAHSTQASLDQAHAWDISSAAGRKAEATQKAYADAIKVGPQGSPAFTAAMADRTKAYVGQANADATNQVAQQNAGTRDNLTYIQAETDSVGMNTDARTKMLTVMQAELAMHAKFGDVLPKEAQDYIDLAGRTADASAALAKQTAAYQEIGSAVGSIASDLTRSITTPFQSGETAAKRFESTATSVFSAVANEITKLAVINPLVNSITGGNSPTINSVGGVLGKLLGGSLFGGSSASSAASITSSAGTTGVGVEAGVGGLYHSGGIAGREPTSMRFYPASLWHGAPRYHTGGVAGNEVPAVLQAGEGVFTPGQMKALGTAASGGGQQQQAQQPAGLYIDARGAGPREIDQLRSQIGPIALAHVQNAMGRGGKFANTVRGR